MGGGGSALHTFTLQQKKKKIPTVYTDARLFVKTSHLQTSANKITTTEHMEGDVSGHRVSSYL
jgi:hypothetical protein